MHLEAFPNCCSSLVVCGFGGSSTAMEDDYADPVYHHQEEEWLDNIEPEDVGFQFTNADDMDWEDMYRTLLDYIDRSANCGFASLVAITDENQEAANTALMRAGFDRMDGVRSGKHKTMTYLWRVPLQNRKKA